MSLEDVVILLNPLILLDLCHPGDSGNGDDHHCAGCFCVDNGSLNVSCLPYHLYLQCHPGGIGAFVFGNVVFSACDGNDS